MWVPQGWGWAEPRVGRLTVLGRVGCSSAQMAVIEQDFQAEWRVKPTGKIGMS